MTLHEAIEHVLKNHQEPMTTRDIADEINKAHLYERGDRGLVPPSQISARINNYPELFKKDNGKIALVNW